MPQGHNAASSLDKMPEKPIEVFFATNREVSGSDTKPEFGKGFHAKRPHYVRYGRAKLKAPKEWESDKFEIISVKLARENIPKSERGKKVLGSSEIFEDLRQRMARTETDTLIYVHGFANTFESALVRAAELKVRYQYDPQKPLNVFAFCWPSDGEMIPYLSYYRDRDDAQASGTAMARALLRLRDWLDEIKIERRKLGRDFCRQHLHLVAHSMGNYALRHAIQRARGLLGGQLERVFDNIFLMAADEDDDTFEKDYKFGILPEFARAVHVYYSVSDVPLDELADITKLLPDRLGTQGPRNKDGLHRKVILVDCTDVDWTGNVAHGWHQYYRLRHEVYKDVRQVLKGVPASRIEGRVYQPDERAYRIVPFDKRDSAGRL